MKPVKLYVDPGILLFGLRVKWPSLQAFAGKRGLGFDFGNKPEGFAFEKKPDVELARELAIKWHGDQKYGDKPYIFHLEDVARTLLEFGHHNSTLIAAAYLHDVIEDTPVTYREILHNFGEAVANLVSALTKVKAHAGGNRELVNEEYFERIRETGAYAITVKLADRIANMRQASMGNLTILRRYQKEYAQMRDILYIEGPFYKAMWAELDRLVGPKNQGAQ